MLLNVRDSSKREFRKEIKDDSPDANISEDNPFEDPFSEQDIEGTK